MNSKIYLAAAFALAFAACTNENEPVTPADGEVAAQVTADINSVRTRASVGQWQDGHVIGISTVNTYDAGNKPTPLTDYKNIPYEYDGKAFGPIGRTIYFQSPEEVTFFAYYPYKEELNENGIIDAKTDADAQERQHEIDFLFTKGAKADKGNPQVKFIRMNDTEDYSFHHSMSQITITFSEGDDIAFTGGKFESYTLKGLVLKGTFNTETGDAKVTDGEQTADLTIRPENVAVDNKVFATAPVILFPQTPKFAKEERETPVEGKIGLEVTVEGVTYHATLTIPGGKTALEAGSHYTFPVRVKKTGLVVGDAEISDWKGITGDDADATL